MRFNKNLFYGLTGLLICYPTFSSQLLSAELNIYSHRQPFLINPFLRAFEKEANVKTNVVFASKGLVQRLVAEGSRSPADVILTVDIARLWAYKDKDLLARIESPILEKNIPSHLRAKDNRWFAFSKRARVLAVSNTLPNRDEIQRIEDLSNKKWRGKICSRPGSHVYNRALLASIIAANGVSSAENWAKGLVVNLARRPQGNDRAQVKAIHEGVCDIAIINNYYFAKLKYSTNPQHRLWASSVNVVFTNQNDRGNHINISGGGVVKWSRSKNLAIKFLEFLTQPTAQRLYGTINYEYPVNPKVQYSTPIKNWGAFEEDKLPIEKIAEISPSAQKIIDRVGW